MRFKVDTSGLTGTADLAERQVGRAIVKGLNESVFGMRFELNDVVDDNVDRTSPYLRALQATRIHKATIQNPVASLTIGGRAGEILAKHEFGYTARFVDIPILSAGKRSVDRYGNLSKRVRVGIKTGAMIIDMRSKKRRKTKTKKPVGRYFSVYGSNARGLGPGIYERTDQNKRLIRISKSERNKRYKATFHIRRDLYEYEADLVLHRIQQSIDFRRANRK